MFQMVRQTRTQIKDIDNGKKEIKLLFFENWQRRKVKAADKFAMAGKKSNT